MFIDYPSGLNNTDISKVGLSDPNWSIVGYTANAPSAGRDRLQIQYNGPLEAGASACVTVVQWTQDCVSPGGFTAHAIEYQNASTATASNAVVQSSPAPTIRDVGVSNYPNTGTMSYGQTAGSVRVGTSFGMFFQVYNPGNVNTAQPQDIYVDLPTGWTPSIAADNDPRFTKGNSYPSATRPGYTTTVFRWSGVLQPFCSSQQAGQLFLNVAVPSNAKQKVNTPLYSTVYGPNGVVKTSWMYTFPPA